MLDRSQLAIGVRFEVPTCPGRIFRLSNFARPMRLGEEMMVKWSDRGTYYVPCRADEATHVHGWESIAYFQTVERLLTTGLPA